MERIDNASGFYFQGLAASRAGQQEIARGFYRSAFELLPTHIEALDNYAIGLVEELRFEEAIPLFEQSGWAEPQSPLAFFYLGKCYKEVWQNRMTMLCYQYLQSNWPDKSPVGDWSHLGQAQTPRRLVAPPFAEGQVWKFRSQGESAPTRVWIRLADLEHGSVPVVHISVFGVTLGNGVTYVSHLPVSAEALCQSDLKLCEEQQQWDLPDDHFGGGYSIWRNAFSKGEGGYFTVPVKEILEGFLQSHSEQ